MIKENFLSIQNEIAKASVLSGRRPRDIKLVAVTKNVSWEKAHELYDLGQRDFGENRFQDAKPKIEVAPTDCRWHFIGTLQANKVRRVINRFVLIHSVDTLELAQKIAQHSLQENRTTSILLQVNTSGELSKHGLSVEGWLKNMDTVLQLPNLQVEGLMTMAPINADEKKVRAYFSRLREMRDKIGVPTVKHLSMGMSRDFGWAIEEGATIVRLGSALGL